MIAVIALDSIRRFDSNEKNDSQVPITKGMRCEIVNR